MSDGTEIVREEPAGTDIALYESPSMVQFGTMRMDGPQAVIQQAASIAKELARLVDEKKLFTVIRGKKHLQVEAWTTMGAMLGIVPVEDSVIRLPDGGYEASVNLIRGSDGRKIGRGSSVCGMDEPTWAERPEYARRSMAITRATGKAYRLGFAWIMVLAGFEPTPSEEMPVEEAHEYKGHLYLRTWKGQAVTEHDLEHGSAEYCVKCKEASDKAPAQPWPAQAPANQILASPLPPIPPRQGETQPDPDSEQAAPSSAAVRGPAEKKPKKQPKTQEEIASDIGLFLKAAKLWKSRLLDMDDPEDANRRYYAVLESLGVKHANELMSGVEPRRKALQGWSDAMPKAPVTENPTTFEQMREKAQSLPPLPPKREVRDRPIIESEPPSPVEKSDGAVENKIDDWTQSMTKLLAANPVAFWNKLAEWGFPGIGAIPLNQRQGRLESMRLHLRAK